MSAESAVKDALEGASTVTDLTGTRIYPDARPQESALPALVYGRVGTTYEPTIHGTTALTRAQMAIAAYAATRASAEALADAATTALLAARLLAVTRAGDYEEETQSYVVAALFEHIS